MTTYTLRSAHPDDLNFLFNVSTKAMEPVHEILHPGESRDLAAEFEEYKKKFEPEKIHIIQHDGKDAGRLRIVRSAESIYIGGIQILPEFQKKGIGTAILKDLIEESNKAGVPITLEVHDVNKNAADFYENLGFKKTNQVGEKWEMILIPTQG